MGKTEVHFAPGRTGALYILCRKNAVLCVNRGMNGLLNERLFNEKKRSALIYPGKRATATSRVMACSTQWLSPS